MNRKFDDPAQFKQDLTDFLRQDLLLRGNRLFPMALLATIFFAIVILDFSPRIPAEISITATGKKRSPEAQAAVAWLAFPTIQYLQKEGLDIRKSKGWETKNGLLISTRNQPAELLLKGYFPRGKAIEFFKTPHSGEILIEVNGAKKIADLFQSGPGKEIIPLHGFSGSLVPVAFAFLISAAKNLSSILLVALACQALLSAVPAAHGGASKYMLAGATAIFLFFVAAFYPGVMYIDSYDQYVNARAFEFGDWHPPMMSILWSLTDKIISGPAGMFLLHLLMAIVSFYLLSRVALLKRKKLFFAPVLLLFLPVVSCLSFAVVKDVSFTVSLVLAFSLWYFWRSTDSLSITKLALILVLLFYASAVRYNALPAILPLTFLFLLDYTTRKKALLIAPAVCVFFLLANHFVVYTVLRASREYSYQVIMGHDLMAIYKITGKNYLPEEYIKKRNLDTLMKRFDHRISDPTAFWGFPLYYKNSLISILENRWFTAIRQNPAAYLMHRWILFKSFLRNFDGTVFCMYPVSVLPQSGIDNPPNALLQETKLGEIHTKFVTWTFTNYGYLFQALTYFFANCILIVIAIRRRSDSAAALNASSLLYLLTYFLVAPGVHFRYVYWAVLATLLSLFVIWLENQDTMPKASGEA